MAVYLISYDLKNYAPSHDYTLVHDKIRSFGNAIHILESTFLVDTVRTPKFMSDELRAVYQPEQHLVVELKPGINGIGFLNDAAWKWINARLAQ